METRASICPAEHLPLDFSDRKPCNLGETVKEKPLQPSNSSEKDGQSQYPINHQESDQGVVRLKIELDGTLSLDSTTPAPLRKSVHSWLPYITRTQVRLARWGETVILKAAGHQYVKWVDGPYLSKEALLKATPESSEILELSWGNAEQGKIKDSGVLTVQSTLIPFEFLDWLNYPLNEVLKKANAVFSVHNVLLVEVSDGERVYRPKGNEGVERPTNAVRMRLGSAAKPSGMIWLEPPVDTASLVFYAAAQVLDHSARQTTQL